MAHWFDDISSADSPSITINQRRSERVILRVPVIVTIETATNESLQDEAYTRVVNAHGGLLTAGIEVADGQLMMLTNPKTRMSRECRVVSCKRANSHEFSISFDFEGPAPDFWTVGCTPANWQSL